MSNPNWTEDLKDFANIKPRRSLAMEAARRVIPEIFDELAELTGRSYPVLDAYRMEDADVALVLMGAAGAGLLTVGAVFSISGNLTASMLSAPRLVYALGRDASLPAWFGGIHAKYHTPANAIVFYALFAIALALSGTFIWLAVMSTLVRLLTYMICIAALPILQKTTEPYEGQFRLPGGLAIPVLAFGLCIWLITKASPDAWLTLLGFLVAGSGLYWYSVRKSAGN